MIKIQGLVLTNLASLEQQPHLNKERKERKLEEGFHN